MLLAAIFTMSRIVHDVLPHLNEEHRASVVSWIRSYGSANINKPLRSAWDEHIKRFPNSRKRALFAILLVAGALSIGGCPLWAALASSKTMALERS